MDFKQNSQVLVDPGKSTTIWTQPKTEEQKRYFSKHAPKRRAYGVIMTILQFVHAAIAMAAWGTIFMWALQKFPSITWLSPLLGIGSLITLHWLFRTTWDTFWYDRLDNDPNTDSSVFMPIAILVLLLVVEINGAEKFLVNNIEKPLTMDAKPVDQEHATLISHFDESYKTDAARIEDVYKTKLNATKKKWNSKIYAAQNESVGSDEAAQRAKRRKVAGLIAQRDTEIAEIETAKADELAKALNDANARKRQEQQRRDRSIARIDSTNVAAHESYADDVNDAGTYAWIISVALLGLISGLGYARVRINVKSGIMPLRNYTVLDAHGSAAERIATAIGDALNRQTMRVSVALHKALSPTGPITSFDGTVIAKQGTYNTPNVKPAISKETIQSLFSGDKQATPPPYPKAVNGLPTTPPQNATARPTVSQCDTDQDRQKIVGADTMLRFTMNKLQGELANLKNESGLPQSIVKRMQERVGELLKAIDTGNFRPSEEEAAKFLAFNDTQLSDYTDQIKAHGGLPEWRRVIEYLENFVTEKTA
jgi:hypothetical protein